MARYNKSCDTTHAPLLAVIRHIFLQWWKNTDDLLAHVCAAAGHQILTEIPFLIPKRICKQNHQNKSIYRSSPALRFF
jgi:hypothetical protein